MRPLAFALTFCLAALPLSRACAQSARSARQLAATTGSGSPEDTLIWGAAEESWYRSNRTIAGTGKALTVVGVAVLIVGASLDSLGGVIAGLLSEYAGLSTWAGADLRATKRMRQLGLDVRRPAALVAMIGVFTFTPVTLVAGTLQSARIRQAHADLSAPLLTRQRPAFQGGGLGLKLTF